MQKILYLKEKGNIRNCIDSQLHIHRKKFQISISEQNFQRNKILLYRCRQNEYVCGQNGKFAYVCEKKNFFVFGQPN